ncbi:hypothetical protein JHD46_05455 [Sulfurimonas sp. SAG-AH-194-C20]|nr:hypothetical protein [Sulfurimonas sp. SAG-AH-194-C20]
MAAVIGTSTHTFSSNKEDCLVEVFEEMKNNMLEEDTILSFIGGGWMVHMELDLTYKSLTSKLKILTEEDIENLRSKFMTKEITQINYIRRSQIKLLSVDLSDPSYSFDVDGQTALLTYCFEKAGVIISTSDDGLLTVSNNSDYSIFSEEDMDTVVDIESLDKIDARIFTYSELSGGSHILDSWWDDEDSHKEYLTENADKYVAYHRKGKDWYISPAVTEVQLQIFTLEESVEEDEYCISDDYLEVWSREVLNKEDTEYKFLQDYISESVLSLELEVAIEALLSNLGEDVFLKLFGTESISEVAEMIPAESYGKFLNTIPFVSYDLFETQLFESFAVSKNLKFLVKLKRMLSLTLKSRGYELILHETDYDDNIFAVRAIEGEDMYHLSILNDLRDEEIDVDNKEDFLQLINYIADDAIIALTRRNAINLKYSEVTRDIAGLFVSMKDSTDAGNCAYGTKSLASKMGIDIRITGGVLASEILKFDKTYLALNAINMAKTSKQTQSMMEKK